MTFKLDPVARFDALQRAKEWQKQFPGNSSGLVAQSPPFQYTPRHGQIPYPAGTGGFTDEIPRIITPEDGVFSNDGVGNIVGGHIDAWGDASELARQALKGKGAVHRSNMQLEYLEELAADAARDKERGIWSSIGSTVGSIAGNMILPGFGGSIGSQIGGTIGGQIG